MNLTFVRPTAEAVRMPHGLHSIHLTTPLSGGTAASFPSINCSMSREAVAFSSRRMSPAQYHLQYRLERACDLLRNTNLPVATIGESLGFESTHHFSRLFRQKIGYPPRLQLILKTRSRSMHSSTFGVTLLAQVSCCMSGRRVTPGFSRSRMHK